MIAGLTLVLLVLLAVLVWEPVPAPQTDARAPGLEGVSASGLELDSLERDLDFSSGSAASLLGPDPSEGPPTPAPDSVASPTPQATDFGSASTSMEDLSRELGETSLPAEGATENPADLLSEPSPSPTPMASPPPQAAPTPNFPARFPPIPWIRILADVKAGDYKDLKSLALDETQSERTRELALQLASQISETNLRQTLYDLLEDDKSPFLVRETAAYTLVEKEPILFSQYLTKVLDRPRVSRGEDSSWTRLLALSFYSDQKVNDGLMMDEVGDVLLELARAKNEAAVEVLSLALGASMKVERSLGLLESFQDNPLVRQNLRRYYSAKVEGGEEKFAARLKRLN